MAYKTALSDLQWNLLKKSLSRGSKRGNGHKQAKRTLVSTILYVVECGIQWRLLPNVFPPWQTVYDCFSRWNERGVWERALDQLTAIQRP